MLDFSNFINLPYIWGFLIATAIFLYVVLDGFDLGVGILFPFAPSDICRDKMMNSIAPFWDGNETWLVLGGGGLFAAFPLAYAILMPAFYIPIIIMLLGLILRGVAFEFRFKAELKYRVIWDYVFHFGSLIAALMQGMILGGFIQGIEVEGRNFAGGAFDWLSAFSVMTGIAVIFGYALIGGTWLIMKTKDQTNDWARKVSSYCLAYVFMSLLLVSISMPIIDPEVKQLWFNTNALYLLLPLPILTLIIIKLLWVHIHSKREISPFILVNLIFLLSYLGLGFSLWPWIVPFEIDFIEAAAANTSLSIMLIGAVIMLPIILAYTAYCYYVFRGKTDEKSYY